MSFLRNAEARMNDAHNYASNHDMEVRNLETRYLKFHRYSLDALCAVQRISSPSQLVRHGLKPKPRYRYIFECQICFRAGSATKITKNNNFVQFSEDGREPDMGRDPGLESSGKWFSVFLFVFR